MYHEKRNSSESLRKQKWRWSGSWKSLWPPNRGTYNVSMPLDNGTLRCVLQAAFRDLRSTDRVASSDTVFYGDVDDSATVTPLQYKRVPSSEPAE